MWVEKREFVLESLQFWTFSNSKGDLADIFKVSNKECVFLTISLNVSSSAWSGSIAIQHDRNTTSTASKLATITSRWRSLMAWDETKKARCHWLFHTFHCRNFGSVCSWIKGWLGINSIPLKVVLWSNFYIEIHERIKTAFTVYKICKR